jgi:uncharacterized protein (DUF1810 family)
MPSVPDNADPFNLHRFVQAQDPVYASVLAELRGGRKRTHWMWFIFPQIAGLGHSATSKHYAIQSRAEAQSYLAHPTLGQRLIECSETILHISGRSAWDIFGSPDDMKLRSCMTLFAALPDAKPVFSAVLGKYFGCKLDRRTLDLLSTADQQAQ